MATLINHLPLPNIKTEHGPVQALQPPALFELPFFMKMTLEQNQQETSLVQEAVPSPWLQVNLTPFGEKVFSDIRGGTPQVTLRINPANGHFEYFNSQTTSYQQPVTPNEVRQSGKLLSLLPIDASSRLRLNGFWIIQSEQGKLFTCLIPDKNYMTSYSGVVPSFTKAFQKALQNI